MSTELAHRATIDQTIASRNQALDHFADAFDALQRANKAAAAAAPSGVYDVPKINFNDARRYLSGRDEMIARFRQSVDRAVWSHLIQATGLDKLMDKTAREEFRAQLIKDPPEVTAETCYATMSQLVEDRELIFRRGIASAFSRLDRRFRSHDGFKIGARVVLSNMLSADGWWNHYQHHDDTLMDIERAFAVMDGRPQPDRDGGIVGAVKLAKAAAGSGWGASAFEAESDYFRVKVFKNGNAHVWFKRDDLLRKVNQLLADYYGAALGAGSAAAAARHSYNRTPAKNYGFWETPEPVGLKLLDAAGMSRREECSRGYEPNPYTVLEPSAGRGALARLIAACPGARLTCVEVQPTLAGELEAATFRPILADFFDLTPAALGQFDRIVMNPPFDAGRDIDHVTHALQFLKPGGRLVSVMCASVEFREDRKTVAFRAMVERFGGRFHDLPPASFAASGTNVNTVILTISTR